MKTRDNRFKIIVPTINSAHYIEDILAYYKSHTIDITVFVDTKSTDDTRQIASDYFEVIDIENPTGYIENVIESFSNRYRREWILRIDDDELPSLRMIDFIEDALSSDRHAQHDVYGFARHQCLASYGGRLITHTGHNAFVDHRQWRLYKTDQVQFHRILHTPGFALNWDRVCRAPDDACMIHLDWVVHSYAERQSKLARYDAVDPGAADRDRAYYLVEDSSPRVRELLPLHLPEFDETTRRLSEKARRRRHESWNWTVDS